MMAFKTAFSMYQWSREIDFDDKISQFRLPWPETIKFWILLACQKLGGQIGQYYIHESGGVLKNAYGCRHEGDRSQI